MRPKRSIFYSALMLTGVHLLLRLIGTSFQVYLSGRIGAAGIGLLQLTMSVGSFAMVAGIAGIRTSAMYLTAEELGRQHPENVSWVLSGCVRYSLIAGGTVAAGLAFTAPYIAESWISNPQITPSLRLFAGFLCVNCLCGVMTGYFTAAGRIGTLAAVEVAEQLFSMTITVLCLLLWAGKDPGRACESVILGSGAGSCMTLVTLLILRLREGNAPGPRIPVARRLTATAVPLALADILKSGITTIENLMVPKRLSLAPGIGDPLASFGILSGMVFPVLMFPACILHALADLLIPELARCAASDSGQRIRYLAGRCLGVALIYGLCFGGGMFLVSEELSMALYDEAAAGTVLKRYSLLIPMLYCDALVDAMTKGLGQQKICVRYNIITSAMDVAGLYILLPLYGMEGYFISFFISHFVNFVLSLRLLLKITGLTLPVRDALLSIAAAAACVVICSALKGTILRAGAYLLTLGSSLVLLGILGPQELLWLKSILHPKTLQEKTAAS